MNCNWIAPAYAAVEWMAFGSRLQRHREYFLNMVPHEGQALVLGDGDGRFLARLATVRPQLEIDAFDLSTSMNTIARERIARSQPKAWERRIRIRDADALTQPFAERHYCAVFTHFFLDCFSEQQLEFFVPALSRAMCPSAVWIISEFQLPAAGLKRWHALAWLKAMYGFFNITARLRTRRLPNYWPLLSAEGWCIGNRMTSMADLISSEVWTHDGLKAGENPLPPSP